MNNKKILMPVFILLVLVQWYVPAGMIWNNEQALISGEEFKFKTAALDPVDPFRGKYITLGFVEDAIEVRGDQEWKANEDVYVTINTGSDGFAKISTVSKEKPKEDVFFFQARVGSVSADRSELTVDFPFDRFYMEESKAYEAEQEYRKASQDANRITYALVNIYKGKAVLKEVMIDGVPLREIVGSNEIE